MQSVEEFRKSFDNIYYTKILKMLAPLEQKRKTAFMHFVFAAFLSAVLLIIFFNSMNNPPSNATLGSFHSVLGVVGFLILIFASSIPKNFENSVKEEIMPALLNSFETFDWTEEETISDEYINHSYLFADYNRRFDDDNFEGNYKNVKISICETELGKKTGSGKNSSYAVRFKGVLVKLVPDRDFKCTTIIKKQGLLNFAPSGLKRVHLEDIEFEKQFNVYSDDQIESRYILTTAFMERFKNLEFVFNASKIEASIKEQGILIGLSVSRDLFKVAKLHRPICDYQQFKQMAEEFASVLELIDELKLNQNIGL